MTQPAPEPFRDPDRPLDERLDDLLGRLTREEKIALLHQHQPAVPRLGLAAFHTGQEALHGLAWEGVATVFPQAIGLGSTWDPELLRRVGAVVGDEVRGRHQAEPGVSGLNVWAPVVNLLRDPRWGRNEEGYAEDPLLTGALSTAYAAGLRGDHPRYLKTAPTLKHFLAYNVEDERDTISMSVRPRVLWEYELPAFRAAIAAGAATGLMPSYNLVNGRPAHLSPLIDAVRTWTADALLVVTDAWAPSNIARSQRYYPTHAEAHAAALRAGIDSFTDQDRDPTLTVNAITEALERGLVEERDVDAALRRVFAIRLRLGELDPPERNPYAAITETAIDRPEHRALARETAARGMVLLKNAGAALPLRAEEPRRVAVIGPLADTLYPDWYSGTMPYETTPLLGIRARLGDGAEVVCHEGADRVALRAEAHGAPVIAPALELFDWGEGVWTLRAAATRRYVTVDETGALVADQVRPHGWVPRETFRLLADGERLRLQHIATGRYVVAASDGRAAATAPDAAAATAFQVEHLASGLDAAANAARAADVAIVVAGNVPCINGRETEDRRDIALPPAHERLVRAVTAANPRTVLVVESSYPMAIPWADEHVPAILWSSHGGQEMGAALADVLFGDRPPAGRLTQTWHRSLADLPDMRDYDVIKTRRTYQYLDREPLYPFGHGLTYSEFRYGDLRLSSPAMDAAGEVAVDVEVTNEGAAGSDEVVQLYAGRRASADSRTEQPRRRLVAFQRVAFGAGETRTVRLTLRAADLAIWDVVRGRMVVEAGVYNVMAGRSSGDIRLMAELRVLGEPVGGREARRGEIRAADFDDYASVRLTDETRRLGDAVAPVDGAGWILFRDVDLGAGVASVTARVARAAPGPAAIRIRLDDPAAGPVAGTLPVPSTGDRHAWATVTTAMREAAGVRDLYFVFDGDAALAAFSLA
ncbi:MAG TPA: glycoside hydrolase family 3 C-terminal domain-containing protein [Candidatus Dormibacteraeota bacterium]|nr:glycoside hydrolase family 3 C-terminal domain-containing protein [Candidatus Dormibacteraeota bacterium]